MSNLTKNQLFEKKLTFQLRRNNKKEPVMAAIVGKYFIFQKQHRSLKTHISIVQAEALKVSKRTEFKKQATFKVTFKIEKEYNTYVDPTSGKFWFNKEFLLKRRNLKSEISSKLYN